MKARYNIIRSALTIIYKGNDGQTHQLVESFREQSDFFFSIVIKGFGRI